MQKVSREAGGAGVDPVCLALVICEGVWSQPDSGRNFVLGTIQRIVAAEFPLVRPFLGIYAVLADAQGVVPVRFQVLSLERERPEEGLVREVEMLVSFASKLASVEVGMLLADVRFPAPGVFRVRLKGPSGACLMERRFTVVPRGGPA